MVSAFFIAGNHNNKKRRNQMDFTRFFLAILIVSGLFLPVMAADEIDHIGDPWYWYNKAVDLANEGKYQEALDANERALAINESIPLAQANKAGILVQLGKYDEAIIAADKALAIKANTTIAFAVAYSNKGDALRHLGRIEEAKVAFAKAFELDSSLVPPDLSSVPVTPAPTRAPLLWATAPAAVALVSLIYGFFLRNRK
jgi:tetratricopeptide (TPR) repeat protein